MGKKGLRCFLAAFLSVALFFLLAGCGGGKKTEGESGSKAKAPETKKEDVSAAFKGKIINVIVPYKPGGGYDTYTRMLQPFLEKYTGATIVVRNVPGGGSLVGANQLYTSPPDGLTIGVVNGMGALTSQIAGAAGVSYDMNKYTWLGRYVAEPQALNVRSNLPIKTPEDLFNYKKTLKIGATGPGASEYINSLALKIAFNLPLDIITGYETSAEIDLAMARNEIDLQTGSTSSRLTAIKSGQQRPLMLIGGKKDPELPDTPRALDLPGISKEGKEIMTAMTAMLEIGRAVAAPPGLAPEKTKFLAEAFAKAMQDPELIKQSKATDRPVDNATPEEMKKIVSDAFNAPEVFKKMVKDSFVPAKK